MPKRETLDNVNHSGAVTMDEAEAGAGFVLEAFPC